MVNESKGSRIGGAEEEILSGTKTILGYILHHQYYAQLRAILPFGLLVHGQPSEKPLAYATLGGGGGKPHRSISTWRLSSELCHKSFYLHLYPKTGKEEIY